MINEYEKFRIQDQGLKNDWFIEVNWEDKNDIKDSQLLKITFPNGDIAYTKRDHVNAMLFAIGSPADQVKLIPQRIVRKRRFEGLVRMVAQKNIKKGEEIISTCYHDLPDLVDEVIGEIKATVDNSPLLIKK